jgi:RNA polymerase sigma-70 factor, ECF subfamily
MEENSLVRKAQEGNQEAFTELVRKYMNKMTHLAYSFTRNRETAEDLSQETFIKAYNAIPRFKFHSSFGTWLYRIAVNTAKDYLRREEGHLEEPLDAHDYKYPEKSSTHPDRKTDQKELSQIINRAMESLPAKHRIILTLRDLQGLSYADISRILKISEGTVDSRLFRARKSLREKIRPYFYPDRRTT